ncbi:MAG: hypothetical protein ABSB78_09850 [Bacteroidota bacterium]
MKLLLKQTIFTFALMIYGSVAIHATPSTIIWIPSVDIQPYSVFHFGIDNYFTLFKKGIGEGGAAFPTDLGLTVGILPFSTIQTEIGVDLLEPLHSPWAFNAKIGIPENVVTGWFPAIAVGGYNFGVQENVTNVNILYALTAKTFPVIGRISAGYYTGNKNILIDPDGKIDNSGVLLSWDKQVTEISENLWLAVDYQSGKNSYGALSFGLTWLFSKNVSVIFARDVYNNNAPSTFTAQVDINI